MPESPDDLSHLLRDTVADVEPGPALDRIRARTQETAMTLARPWLLAAAGAVAATVATVTVVAQTSEEDTRNTAGPAGPVTSAAVEPTPTDSRSDAASPGDSASPSSTASPGASASASEPAARPSPPPAAATALPVYYVGDTPAGPRLFREFVPDPARGSSRLVHALDRAVSVLPLDPDYRSDWPPGTQIDTVGVEGGVEGSAAAPRVIVVPLEVDLAARPAGMSADVARLAVQQLVYTAQAVVQHRSPVRFTAPDGRPLETVLGVPVGESVQAADPMTVQAPVWVITPQNGDTVDRRFTVEGRGAFFEATVSWQLLRRDGSVVQDGFATAEECCTLSPYAFTVRARPGDYTLRVFAVDESGGEGVEPEDTKLITVR